MRNELVTWETAVQSLRRDPAAQALVRACFYDDPLIEAARRFHESTEWRATRDILDRPGRVLELGAGRGIASYALARDGWQVTALEPDHSDVVGAGAIRALAKEAELPIHVVQEWGESLPFDDGLFDLVYCRAVMHHARNLAVLCREAARVLRPGGMFCCVREHVISRSADLPTFLQMHPLHHLYGGEHAYLLSEYRKALQGAGLRIVKELGPFSSDINLFPATVAAIKEQIAARLHLPGTGWVPNLALNLMDWKSNAPGRHYSFIARKLPGAGA